MDAAARLLRAGGWTLVGLGLGRAAFAVIRDEGVNVAGIVPGAAIGFLAIALGAYALMGSSLIRQRLLWWLAYPALLAALVVSSTAILVSGEVPPGLYARGAHGLVGLVVFLGYFALIGTVVYTIVFVPAVFALAWVADQIGPLRRRGAGDALRRGHPIRPQPREHD